MVHISFLHFQNVVQMKNMILLTACLLLSVAGFSQKLGRTSMSVLRSKIQLSSALSASFKQSAAVVLGVDDEEDCTPPPCGGLIDPWTCECIPDIKDPWGDEQVATKLRAFQAFETGIQQGLGKDLLPKSLVSQAQQKFPGNSLKAIVGRLNLYTQAGAQ